MSKNFISKMQDLAKKTSLTFDGSEDKRLFPENNLTVFVGSMTKAEYKAMEQDMSEYRLKGDGYEIYAWNDASGYGYWKEQAQDGDCNYVQVTAHIENVDEVDPFKLKSDMDKAIDYFNKYENADELIEFLNSKEKD